MGFVWFVPVSSKENDRAGTKGGGGNRIVSGGVQNCFWGGALWYVFPSPEFSPPLFFQALPENDKNGTHGREIMTVEFDLITYLFRKGPCPAIFYGKEFELEPIP